MNQKFLLNQLESEFDKYLLASERAWRLYNTTTHGVRQIRAKYIALKFMGKYELLATIMEKYLRR